MAAGFEDDWPEEECGPVNSEGQRHRLTSGSDTKGLQAVQFL